MTIRVSGQRLALADYCLKGRKSYGIFFARPNDPARRKRSSFFDLLASVEETIFVF
jgi:hypothetical protein